MVCFRYRIVNTLHKGDNKDNNNNNNNNAYSIDIAIPNIHSLRNNTIEELQKYTDSKKSS